MKARLQVRRLAYLHLFAVSFVVSSVAFNPWRDGRSWDLGLAEALGAALLPFLVSVWIIRRHGAIPAYGLVVGWGFLMYLGNQRTDMRIESATQLATTAPSLEATAVEDIRVVVSTQDAEGARQADLDGVFLKNFEAYVLQATRSRTAEFLGSKNLPGIASQIASESLYVESNGRKLAVIRLRTDQSPFGVIVAGIVGDELKRVGCFRNTAKETPVAITHGQCGAKVEEVFRTDLQTKIP